MNLDSAIYLLACMKCSLWFPANPSHKWPLYVLWIVEFMSFLALVSSGKSYSYSIRPSFSIAHDFIQLPMISFNCPWTSFNNRWLLNWMRLNVYRPLLCPPGPIIVHPRGVIIPYGSLNSPFFSSWTQKAWGTSTAISKPTLGCLWFSRWDGRQLAPLVQFLDYGTTI